MKRLEEWLTWGCEVALISITVLWWAIVAIALTGLLTTLMARGLE